MLTRCVHGLVVIVALTSATTIPDCNGLTETIVARNASVELPEHFLRDWVATTDIIPGIFSVTRFKVQQGGHVIVNVAFGVDNLFSNIVGASNPASWCDQKGDHDFSIKIRAICNYTFAFDSTDPDFDNFWVQGETQIGEECGNQRLGFCRILKVRKPNRGNMSWTESQDGQAGGGSMTETANGTSLILKWDTCPRNITTSLLVAEPLRPPSDTRLIATSAATTVATALISAFPLVIFLMAQIL